MFCRATIVPALLLLALGMPGVASAEPLPPASQWLPPETLLVAELTNPEALLDVALSPEVAKTVETFPALQEVKGSPQFKQFLFVVRFLEAQLETDWKTGLRTLLGEGVTFAVVPNAANGNPAAVLIIDSSDTAMLNKLHDVILTFARNEAEKKGNAERIQSADYHGVTSWTIGGKEAHAIVGNRFIISNRPEALRAVLDRREAAGGKSLAASATYQAAKRAAGTDAAVTAYANVAVLKKIPNVNKALTSHQNPLLALLFAGVSEALAGSSWMSLGLEVDGHTLSLEATVDGKAVDPKGAASFARAKSPSEGALPSLSVPRQIAGISFYRDLHGFYAAKDDLFPERTSGLIFFENMMGIFFSGRDLTDEVLAELEPELRLVVAEQEYDQKVGTPQMQIPGFAAIFRLAHPDKFGIVVEEAWQKFIGLMNFTRGQKALPGLIIDKATHDGVSYTTAYFSAAEETDRSALPMRYNLRPALVVVDDHLILSSTDVLTRDLIDALAQEKAKTPGPLPATHSLVDVDSPRLASILGANRDGLVRNNMVQEGNNREEAETEIDLLLLIVKMIGQVTLDLGSDAGQPHAKLGVELNLP